MAERTPPPNIAEYTVTALSMAIKRTMEDSYGYVRLRGEISGYRGPHSSGHAYFALKDDRARLEAVIWKGVFGNLAFKPEEGLEVIVSGKVTTFPGASKYQIVIDSMEPAGAGALMALLEERKKKLAAEGLFDEARKRPLPFLPAIIGVITSPTGAVIRDMLHGFEERFPSRVLIWPVRVQGETCAAEVAAAIRGFNAFSPDGPLPRPDVLIVARGGGSIEDLWSFNEEIVVRAAAASHIPLISAVGHETDWTLIDLAADARAPTPTKAAEWAVPKYAELLARSQESGARLHAGIFRQIEARRGLLKSAGRGLPRLRDLIAMPRQRFDAAASRLERSLVSCAAASRARLGIAAARLNVRLLSVRTERAGERLQSLGQRARQCFGANLQKRRAAFLQPAARLQAGLLRRPAERGRDRLEGGAARQAKAFAVLTERRRRALSASVQLFESLSYKNVLSRGFALVRDASGRMLRRAHDAAAAGLIEIEFADARVAAHTEQSANPAPRSEKRKPGAQGQLF